jgi:Domain of unknown function (DUF4209)
VLFLDSHDSWAEYERLEVESPYSPKKLTILAKLIQEPAANNSLDADNLQWERSAYQFATCTWNELTGSSPQVLGQPKDCKKLIENIDVDGAVSYFNNRVQTTMNPYHKARIATTLWQLQHKPESARVATLAIKDVAKQCLAAGHYLDFVKTIQIASNFSIRYNLNDLTKEVEQFAIDSVSELYRKRQYRWLIEPFQVIASIGRQNPLEMESLRELESKGYRAASFFHTAKNFHLQRSIYNELINLDEVSDESAEKKEIKKRKLLRQIANSWRDEGDSRLSDPNGSLASVVFYRNAHDFYEKAGSSKMMKQMLSKTGEASKSMKWREVTSDPIEIPALKLDGKNPNEIYERICEYQVAPPLNWESSSTSLQDTLSTIVFDGRYPVTDGKKESKVIRAKRSKVMYIQIAEIRFASALELLENEHKISAESLFEFIKVTGIMADDWSLLGNGLDAHFAGDFISSIHVLLPQLEVILRQILLKNSIPIEKNERGAISTKEMGGILSEKEVKKILGAEFTAYLQLKFTDKEGMNIRNEVAHGLMKGEKFNHLLSCSLIYVALQLCAVFKSSSIPK